MLRLPPPHAIFTFFFLSFPASLTLKNRRQLNCKFHETEIKRFCGTEWKRAREHTQSIIYTIEAGSREWEREWMSEGEMPFFCLLKDINFLRILILSWHMNTLHSSQLHMGGNGTLNFHKYNHNTRLGKKWKKIRKRTDIIPKPFPMQNFSFSFFFFFLWFIFNRNYYYSFSISLSLLYPLCLL